MGQCLPVGAAARSLLVACGRVRRRVFSLCSLLLLLPLSKQLFPHLNDFFLMCAVRFRTLMPYPLLGAGQQAQAHLCVARKQVPLAAEGDAYRSRPRQERRVERRGDASHMSYTPRHGRET